MLERRPPCLVYCHQNNEEFELIPEFTQEVSKVSLVPTCNSLVYFYLKHDKLYTYNQVRFKEMGNDFVQEFERKI